jgi:DNA-binding beta-propeller fold protein YncE
MSQTVHDAEHPETAAAVESAAAEATLRAPGVQRARRRRRGLLIASLALFLALVASGGLFYRYIVSPAPLPELLLPQVKVNYPPHYVSSIYGVDTPVGVAVSQDGKRVYVAESGGERLVRVFDRNGNPLGTLTPPNTSAAERAPVYVATDRTGRVYVTDRLQFAIFVYSADGRYVDTIVAPDLTLSAYIAIRTGDHSGQNTLSYNVYKNAVSYQPTGGNAQDLPLPNIQPWAPLGIRITPSGRIYLTDVTKDRHRVREIILGELLEHRSWLDFNPENLEFGASGQGDGEFSFPNAAMTDSQGRTYVTDGNNGRIAVWDKNQQFLFNFAFGTADGAVSLPRGLFIDRHDRLHVVDAVGQSIRVYDVSGPEPAYLFSFGDVGADDGLFNYPADIAVDDSGRLYIADRDNNRVQVWSY